MRKLGALDVNGKPGPMVETKSTPSGDSNTPSGFTFLGQFIDHDITLDTPAMGDQIPNGRTPNLDLDCVYGGGRDASPHLYQRRAKKVKMVINGVEKEVDASNRGLQPAEGTRYSDTRCDLQHSRTYQQDAGTAIIGNPRNDENAIVSQIQFSMIKFHNSLVDHYIEVHGKKLNKLAPAEAEEIFEKVRDHVTHYYHKEILEEFLPGLIGKHMVVKIATEGRRYYYKGGFFDHPNACILASFMPVEFSVAAYRFGHSQVRQSYQMRGGYFAVDLFDPGNMKGGLRGFQPISQGAPDRLPLFLRFLQDAEADHHRKTQKPTITDGQRHNYGPVKTPFAWQPARKIDTRLTEHLFVLHQVGVVDVDGLGSLASRNLNRGRVFRLPSG
ncbi:peroxidase family protein [Breoghania sp.]|uniref:peroxidase family protein n=1 Tax=Breoghania sp. TaxID=2065378 RepID=UPI0026308907|nr:peroxidase family protein [Breoghania sp.]MDJ0933628.1 peroxidase family protein [Breoghania sp.]